jgi:hypothetical protein
VCVCVDAGFPLSHPTGPGKSLRERKKRERKKRKEHIQQANERKKTPCHKSKAAPCSTVMNDRGASDAKKTSKAFFFLLLPSSSYFLCIALDEDAICDLLYAEQTPPLFPANPPRIFPPPPIRLPTFRIGSSQTGASPGWEGYDDEVLRLSRDVCISTPKKCLE